MDEVESFDSADSQATTWSQSKYSFNSAGGGSSEARQQPSRASAARSEGRSSPQRSRGGSAGASQDGRRSAVGSAIGSLRSILYGGKGASPQASGGSAPLLRTRLASSEGLSA